MSLQLFGYLLHGNPHYIPPPEKRPAAGVTRYCAICNAPFTVASKGHGKVYCGTVCKTKAKIQKLKSAPETSKCVMCGKDFEPKRFGHATCSAECSHALKLKHNRSRKQQGQKDWGYEVKCSECDTTFVKKHATHATCSKYCSNKRSHKREAIRRKNVRAAAKVQAG